MTVKILHQLLKKFDVNPAWVLEERGEKLLNLDENSFHTSVTENKGITNLIKSEKIG